MYALGIMFAVTWFCQCFLLRGDKCVLDKIKNGILWKGFGIFSKKNILCVSCDLTCPAYPCSYILLLLALSGRSLFPIFSSRNAEHVMKQSAFLLSLNVLIFELVQVPENRLGKIPIIRASLFFSQLLHYVAGVSAIQLCPKISSVL